MRKTGKVPLCGKNREDSLYGKPGKFLVRKKPGRFLVRKVGKEKRERFGSILFAFAMEVSAEYSLFAEGVDVSLPPFYSRGVLTLERTPSDETAPDKQERLVARMPPAMTEQFPSLYLDETGP